RDITEAAAKSFATLAERMRQRGNSPDAVAHFLTQCLFCCFAEDVGLLPGQLFDRLINNRSLTPERLGQNLTNLFQAMKVGDLFGVDDVPWFNGGLFQTIAVPRLDILDVTELRNAAAKNWSAIDVSIFGTLFERGLDPSKRSQLGAHYTDPATIERIIDPVVRRPLLREWAAVKEQIAAQLTKSKKRRRAGYRKTDGSLVKASAGDAAFQAAEKLYVEFLHKLEHFRVLDPACGSGNFLYLALKCLKDVEHLANTEAEALGLDRQVELFTGPANVLGIELNEYAAELARVTVWIGELQWRLDHGYPFKTNPVLEPLDHIECRDALVSFSNAGDGSDSGACSSAGDSSSAGARAVQMPGAHEPLGARTSLPASAPPTPPRPHEPVVGAGTGMSPAAAAAAAVDALSEADALLPRPSGEMAGVRGSARENDGHTATEAPWPRADVVVGNPPILGGSNKRGELGGDYFDALASVFAGRVPGGADLVCYWFDKARVQIANGELGAAGLVATQSIRAGSNRTVLKAIGESTRIFDAWSDEPWINDGAAVRVSLVCFGIFDQAAVLDGQSVRAINADLSVGGTLDVTHALPLHENQNTSFEGTKKYGKFDISGRLARSWLGLPNPNGRSNFEVVKPWRNGQDLSRRASDTWVIDFGTSMSETDAALFEEPFAHVVREVKPDRLSVRRVRTARLWWIHEEARVSMRAALNTLTRYIATPRVAKHRFFVFLDASILPDTRLNLIARTDDTIFGVLHSRIHEVWALAQASIHGDGAEGGRPTYNAKSCFETFPFPAGLTPADTAHQQTEAVPSSAHGALIPAGLADAGSPSPQPSPQRGEGAKTARSAGVAPKVALPAVVAGESLKAHASRIAEAAARLNSLRENWLNPPEWTQRVPEVVPLGMDRSPYPDRVVPKPGLSAADAAALQKRTLTNLYNQRPAWLAMAHEALDTAVAAAYGWTDYTPQMSDDELLARLLSLNLARAGSV
ncbi:MAG: hypothetical protein Q8M33_01575, partial [Hydrogenophaga sp.]|nr:hypothetical protein [Hydrogenophaga sp.]